MKRISLNISVLLILVFGFQSCTKSFLELEPKTGQSEANYYKTEDEAFNSLVAVYDALSVQNWEFVPIMSDIFSDDAFAGGSSATDMLQWHEIEQSRMNADNNSAGDLWNRCYSGIYRANLYMQKQAGITWTHPENKARFEAEAKFARGYFYWDLVRHYGWVPIITEVLPSVDDYKSLPQSTPEDVYKQVAADLLAALPDLPLTVPDNEKGRVTKYAVEALIARIYMFYQGFAKPVYGITTEWSDGTTTIDKAFVKTALDDIIENGPYTLMTNYADIFDWAHENNSESIFELQYSEKSKSDDWGGWGINGNFSVIFYGMRNPVGYNGFWDSGWSFATITWSLVNEYEPGDPRKDATVFDADANMDSYLHAFENTGYFNKKWMPRSQYRPTDGTREHNYPVNFVDIRLADVLLMASEIYLNDDPAKSLDYFNRVRTRSMGQAAAKSSITLDDIYHERRVELAGEGSRKWDLLRRGFDYAKQKIDESFVVPNGTPNAEDFAGREFKTDTWGMFPIPSHELRNTNSGVLKQFVPAYQ